MPSPSSEAAAEPPAPPNRPASSASEAEQRSRRCETISRLRLTRRAPGVDRVAHRLDRLDLRRAAGRHEARHERRDHADQQADDDRARRDHRAGRGQLEAERGEQRCAGRGRAAAPAEDAEHRGGEADRERLGDTELSTWRRDAPSVRSSANSRERWATVTANVLKIRKPPTSTATPANTSRPILRKPSESVMSDAALSACSLPVRTTAVPPSAPAMRGLELLGRGAALGRATISVIAPGSRAIFCTSSSGIVDADDAERVLVADLGDAGDLVAVAGVRPAISSSSPTAKSSRSAVALSSVTCPGSSAGPPST